MLLEPCAHTLSTFIRILIAAIRSLTAASAACGALMACSVLHANTRARVCKRISPGYGWGIDDGEMKYAVNTHTHSGTDTSRTYTATYAVCVCVCGVII